MRVRHVLVGLFLALWVVNLSAQKEVAASKAWIKAPAAGETSAAAYVVIDNPTMYDVYVVSAQTDAAASVMFVKTAEATGAEPEVVEQVTAPAYDSVELKPGGVHLRLNGLKHPLNPGDKVRILLATDNGLAIEATAEVRR